MKIIGMREQLIDIDWDKAEEVKLFEELTEAEKAKVALRKYFNYGRQPVDISQKSIDEIAKMPAAYVLGGGCGWGRDISFFN